LPISAGQFTKFRGSQRQNRPIPWLTTNWALSC